MLYHGMFCSRRQIHSGQAQVHSAGREHDKMFHTGEAKGIMLSQSVLITRGVLELCLFQNHPGNNKKFTGMCYAKFLFCTTVWASVT